MQSKYEIQACKFLEETGTTFKAKFICSDKYFPDDQQPRDIYQITLTRGKNSYSFRFGQAIMYSTEYVEAAAQMRRDRGESLSYVRAYKKNTVKTPTAYDVLTCVQKYDVGTFENFCSDFGYDTDSRKAEKLYFDVQKEFSEINKLFHDVLDQLQEIQ